MAPTDPSPRPPVTPNQGPPPGRVVLVLGFAFAAFAIWVFPPLLGGIGIILGLVAVRKGERLGWWVVGAGVVGALLGLGLNALPQNFVDG
ncbi:MAG: hypothetical protein FJW88_05715 [Actinobacteria bacterium]|nr:hypothetical protein [Actinomycetota bacterium]